MGFIVLHISINMYLHQTFKDMLSNTKRCCIFCKVYHDEKTYSIQHILDTLHCMKGKSEKCTEITHIPFISNIQT